MDSIAINEKAILLRYLSDRHNLNYDKIVTQLKKNEPLISEEDPAFYHTIIMTMIDLTGDPLLGLTMGQLWRPSYFQGIGFLLASHESISSALETYVYLAKKIDSLPDVVRISFQEDSVSIICKNDDLTPYLADMVFAVTYRVMKTLLPSLSLISVDLCRSNPGKKHQEDYFRFFECPILFDSTRNQINLAYTSFYRGLSIDKRFYDLSMKGLSETISRLLIEPSFSGLVKKSIMEVLREKQIEESSDNYSIRDVSSAEVATYMEITPRTLQRNIKKEGASYKKIIHEMMLSHVSRLKNKGYSINRISAELNLSPSELMKIINSS